MSKLGKIALGLGVFLLMAGGLLAMTGWIMGGDTSIEFTRNGRTLVVTPFGFRGNWIESVSVTESLSESVMEWTDGNSGSVAAEDLGAFTDINVDAPLADVVLQEGENYSLYMEWSDERYAMEYTMEDGLLKIWSVENGNINFGWDGDWDDHAVTVTITYPASTGLGDVDVSAGMGDVDIYDLSAKRLVLDADMGSVLLSDTTLDQMDITVDMGQLDGSNLEVTGLTKATASMGSIDLNGTLRAMDLECDMGNITVYTNLPQSEYRYDLSVDMGSLTYGSIEAIGGEMTGGNGTHSIQADCNMGSLEIHFD